jgi:hypothetical protein
VKGAEAAIRRLLPSLKSRLRVPARVQGPVREWMLVGIAECIVKWREVDIEEVDRYRRERLPQMVKIADDLSNAVRKLGAAIEAASAKLAVIEDSAPPASPGSFSAELHLCSIIAQLRPAVTKAVDALGPRSFDRRRCQEASWNTLFRPGRGAHHDVSLAQSIYIFLQVVNRSVWREGALTKEEAVLRKKPLTDDEIEDLLRNGLSGWDGLPLVLTINTNKRRKQRAQKARREGGRPPAAAINH